MKLCVHRGPYVGRILVIEAPPITRKRYISLIIQEPKEMLGDGLNVFVAVFFSV
jgi:hypothetical protein